jgi:hypothetical protein
VIPLGTFFYSTFSATKAFSTAFSFTTGFSLTIGFSFTDFSTGFSLTNSYALAGSFNTYSDLLVTEVYGFIDVS